jgi:hypothetical protein
MRGVLFYSVLCTGYFLLRFSKWQAFFSHCISIMGISFFCLWPVQKESLQVMGPKIMAGLYSHDFWKELSSFQKQMSISCWCWTCECCCFNTNTQPASKVQLLGMGWSQCSLYVMCKPQVQGIRYQSYSCTLSEFQWLRGDTIQKASLQI